MGAWAAWLFMQIKVALAGGRSEVWVCLKIGDIFGACLYSSLSDRGMYSL